MSSEEIAVTQYLPMYTNAHLSSQEHLIPIISVLPPPFDLESNSMLPPSTIAESIKVVVRFRAHESNELNNISLKDDGKSVSLRRIETVRMSQTHSRHPSSMSSPLSGNVQAKIKLFSFDAVTNTPGQKEFYENYALANVIDFTRGCSSTIIAYGSTGSGKTFTITGDDSIETRIIQQSRASSEDPCFSPEDSHGILPRSIETIFTELNESQVQYTLKCSFLEVYNEELRDLLVKENQPPKKIIMQECPKRGTIVHNTEEVEVKSYRDIFKCMRKGVKNRKIGVTQENHRSSRSHTIFILSLEQQMNQTSSFSKLNIVDLAGSERLTSMEQQKIKETKNINKSLLSLTKCITHLSDPTSDHRHVPFRESKLTRLLKESLGGSSKTTVICTARVLESHLPETLRTLRFARETKKIQMQIQIRDSLDDNNAVSDAHNDSLLAQIQYLKAANAQLRVDNHQLTQELRKRQLHPKPPVSPMPLISPFEPKQSVPSFNQNSTQKQQSGNKTPIKSVSTPTSNKAVGTPMRQQNSQLQQSSFSEEAIKWKNKYVALKRESEQAIKQLQVKLAQSNKKQPLRPSQPSPKQSKIMFNQLAETVKMLNDRYLEQEMLLKQERAQLKSTRAEISLNASKQNSGSSTQIRRGSLKTSKSMTLPESSCESCVKTKLKMAEYEQSLGEFEKLQAKMLDENLKDKKILADLTKKLLSNPTDITFNIVMPPPQTPSPSAALCSLSFTSFQDEVEEIPVSNSQQSSFSSDIDENDLFFEQLQQEIELYEIQSAKILKDVEAHKSRMNEQSRLSQSYFGVDRTPVSKNGGQSNDSSRILSKSFQQITQHLGSIMAVNTTPTQKSHQKQKKIDELTPIGNKSFFSTSGTNGYFDVNMSRLENSLYDDFEIESIHNDSISYQRRNIKQQNFLSTFNNDSNNNDSTHNSGFLNNGNLQQNEDLSFNELTAD